SADALRPRAGRHGRGSPGDPALAAAPRDPDPPDEGGEDQGDPGRALERHQAGQSSRRGGGRQGPRDGHRGRRGQGRRQLHRGHRLQHHHAGQGAAVMLTDLVAILWAPFLMCLVLTGTHAYLGVHVLAREVVFVDIAMAQIAALGATVAFLVGYEVEMWQSYAYALGATLVGAVVLALTRSRRRHVSQEAVIGVVYAVSSAAAVLVADRSAHGAEQVRGMLVGNLLSVTPFEVGKVALLYALVGVVHWFCRRPFFLISTDPGAAYDQGWRVRLWDLLFYASFGVVVASSVRIAGVLLVFSYLIVPALAAVIAGGSVTTRLIIGWAFGTVVSVIGMVASAALDLPTGATVVCAFGLTLMVFGLASRGRRVLGAAALPAGSGTAGR